MASLTKSGAQTLMERFTDLACSREVIAACREVKGLKSEARVERYLNRLEAAVRNDAGRPIGGQTTAEHLQYRLTRSYCLDTSNEKLVEKVAHGLHRSEVALAIRQGRGGDLAEISYDEVRSDYVKMVSDKREKQISSLSSWLTYLQTNDGQTPAWFRYLVVRDLRTMGAFDRGNGSFARRSKDTVAPFPEINAEAIGFVFNIMNSHDRAALCEKVSPDTVEDLQARIARGKFSELYGFALKEVTKSLDRSRLEGAWVRYSQGSDPAILENALAGKGTGWCTATGSAPQHLEGGDFYVYSTKDDREEFSLSRVAIRMEAGVVAEIRGIGPSQEIEPELLEVATEKASALPGYERFETKTNAMRRMTDLYARCFEVEGDEKVYRASQLTKDELRFLYEVDEDIEGFGYERDPRIDEVLCCRDKIVDYAAVYECDRSQVVTDKESFTESTRVFIGDLQAEDYHLLERHPGPLVIAGNACFEDSPIVRIPPQTRFCGDAVFRHADSLTHISEGVIFCRGAWFGWAEHLTSIGDNVVFRQRAEFLQCRALKTVKSNVFFSRGACFDSCLSLAIIEAGGVFKGDALFNWCENLNSIHPSVVFEGGVAMSDCPPITRGRYERLHES